MAPGGHVPAAEAPGDSVTGANNYLLSFKDPVFDNGVVMKFDHRFSERHSVFLRYSWRQFGVERQGAFKNAVTGDKERRGAPGIAFDDTFTLNPSTVLNFRYGLARYSTAADADSVGTNVSGFGFPSSFLNLLPFNALPQITISNGFTTLSNPNKRNRASEDSHTFRTAITKIVSGHMLKMGGEHRILNSNIGSLGANAVGAFGFDQVFTRGPNPQVAGVNLGHGMASLLLGYPASGSVANNAATADRTSYWGFYLHDDWRVNTRLTLNLGIRYEYEGDYVERYNRMNRGFEFTTESSLAAAARANYGANPIPQVPAANFNVRGGLLFAGVNGVPRNLSDLDRNNIAPRLGFASGDAEDGAARRVRSLLRGQHADRRNAQRVQRDHSLCRLDRRAI